MYSVNGLKADKGLEEHGGENNFLLKAFNKKAVL